MTNTIIATLALVVSAGLSWAGAPEGKEVYTAKCAPCHGANGEGKAAIAKMYNVTQHPLPSQEVHARPGRP
jgi:cytochrome c